MNGLRLRVAMLVLMMTAVMGLASTVHAEVYQWTDENGKVHFGDRPPANVNAETLDLPEANSSDKPQVSDAERRERQMRLLKIWEEERRVKEQAKAQEQEKWEKRKEYCRRLLGNLKDSERIGRYYRYDKSGERVYMSDEQADQYRQALKNTYRKECEK